MSRSPQHHVGLTRLELIEDPALTLAFTAAAKAAAFLAQADASRTDWPQLYDSRHTRDTAAFWDAKNCLAPFVRDNPAAPAEALYRHARVAGVHGGPRDQFASLPFHLRFAYELFQRELLAADAAIAAERRRGTALRPTGRRQPLFPGGTVLERLDGQGDKVDVTERLDRPKRSAPKKGKS